MGDRYVKYTRSASATPTRGRRRREQPKAESTPLIRRTKSLKDEHFYKGNDSFALSSIDNSSISTGSCAFSSSPAASVSSGSCSDDDIDYDDTISGEEEQTYIYGCAVRPQRRVGLQSTSVATSASVSSLNISIDPHDQSIEAYALRRRLLQRKFQRLQMKTQALKVRDIQLQARYADLRHQRSLLCSPVTSPGDASCCSAGNCTAQSGLHRNSRLRRSQSMPSYRPAYKCRSYSHLNISHDHLQVNGMNATAIGGALTLEPDLILKEAERTPAISSFSATVLEMKSLQQRLDTTCKTRGKRKLFKLGKLKRIFKRGA